MVHLILGLFREIYQHIAADYHIAADWVDILQQIVLPEIHTALDFI